LSPFFVYPAASLSCTVVFLLCLLVAYPQHFFPLLKTAKDHNFNGYFFETKGVSQSSAFTAQFEFVMVNSPSLYEFAENAPDPQTFSEHLTKYLPSSEGSACSFWNLSRDAILIAPRHNIDYTSDGTAVFKICSHLGAFLRGATTVESVQLWHLVAQKYVEAIQAAEKGRRVWLSTSGNSVAWLHFRLDSRPKYYAYAPFKSA